MTKSGKAASKSKKGVTKRDKGKSKKSEVLSNGPDESFHHDPAHVTHDDLHRQPREELSNTFCCQRSPSLYSYPSTPSRLASCLMR